jgi:hypothetical protein
MALTPEQVERLSQVIHQTQDQEIDCDDFVRHLAAWSERMINGGSIDEATDEVRGHLSICPECREEFQVLIEVLSGE